MNDELRASAQAIVDMYIANKATKYEFVCCITPIGKEARETSKVWKAWDRLRRALGEDL